MLIQRLFCCVSYGSFIQVFCSIPGCQACMGKRIIKLTCIMYITTVSQEHTSKYAQSLL